MSQIVDKIRLEQLSPDYRNLGLKNILANYGSIIYPSVFRNIFYLGDQSTGDT